MTAVARRMTLRIYLYLGVGIVSTGILALIWAGWSHLSPSSQAADTLQLVRFYPPEGDQQPYRFSRATSQILITTIPATPAKLTLRVRSPLPMPPRPLMIAVDQRPLAQLVVGEQARVVAVLLPRSAQPQRGGLLFDLKTKSVDVPDESRKLGLAFSMIAVTALTASDASCTPVLLATLIVLVWGAMGCVIISRANAAMRRAPKQASAVLKVAVTPRFLDPYLLPTAGGCLLYTVVFSWFSIQAYQLFLTHAYDLGVYDQTLWLISRGYPPYSTTMGVHILGNHGALLVYPLALLYLIVPDVRALLVLQSAALALGGWLLYRMGADRQHPLGGALVATAYLLHPAVQHLNMSDFHPDALAATALIAAFWCAERRRWALMFVACALVLAAKENFALTVAAFGVWRVLQRQTRQGIALVVVSLGWFLLVTKGIQPYYNGLDRPVHLDRYQVYGSSMAEILTTFVTRPGMVLNEVLSTRKLLYLVYLALPFGLLCWLNPRPLVVALPALALNLITDYAPQTAMQNHYDALIAPVLAVAALGALVRLSARVTRKRTCAALAAVGLLAGALLTHRAVPSSTAANFSEATATTNERRSFYAYVLSRIPPDAGVMAQSRFQPHLAHRQQAFLLPKPFETADLTNPGAMPFRPNIEYIVYDSHQRLSPYMSDRDAKRILADGQKQQPYTKLIDLDGVLLLRRADRP